MGIDVLIVPNGHLYMNYGMWNGHCEDGLGH